MSDTLKKTILLIDDDEVHLSIAESMLNDRYEIYSEKSGKGALDRLSDGFVPDLILLDILMPGMDGWEVYRRIRELTYLSNVPVAFFTSLTEKIDIMHAHDIGAIDYIMKPFEKEDLLKRVSSMLKK